MFPFTNAPRLPNIGLTSTRGSSGTPERNRSLSASVGFGICMRGLHVTAPAAPGKRTPTGAWCPDARLNVRCRTGRAGE